MLSSVFIFRGKSSIPASLLLAATFLLAGCKVNEQYSIDDINDIDTDVTLFSEGLDVPLGDTEVIKVDSLISKLDEDVRKLIEKNGDSYAFKTSGSLNLDEQIKGIDLSSLKGIDGVSLNESIEYDLEFNKDDFKVDGSKYEEKVKVSTNDIVDFGQQKIQMNDSFMAEISEYCPDDDQLSIQPEPMNSSFSIISTSSKEAIGTALELLAQGDPTKELEVPAELVKNEITIESTEVSVDPVTINLDDVITKIEDLKLDDNAKLQIGLKLNDCFLTDGTVSTDISVDLSELFKVEGEGVLVLKESLTSASSFQTTISKGISELVYKNEGNRLTLSPKATMSGKINVSGLKTTCNKFAEFAQKDLSLEISFSYTGIKIADATITLSEINVNEIPAIKQNVSFNCVAEGLQSINYIKLDSPLLLELGLDKSVGSMTISPKLTLDIPEGMGFKYGDTTLDNGGTVTILDGTSPLAKGSPISETVNITSINPSVEGSNVSYSGDLEMHASAKVYGKVKISELQSPDSKFEISAKINGVAKISDYSVETGNIAVDSPSISQYITSDVSGAGEFGAFTVIPAGRPVVEMNFKMPEYEGFKILAGNSGFVIELPKMITPVVSDLSGYHYDAATNTITVRKDEEFPTRMSFGINRLELKPEKTDDGKYVVKDSVKVYGELAIGATTITKDMVESINKEEISISIEIPTIKASEVRLSKELSFDLSTEKDITLVKADDLPAELKYLKELTFSDVFASIGANFTNLPDIGKDFKIDAAIELPSFITPSKLELKGSIKDNKFITDKGEQTFKVKMDKLSDIDMSAHQDISGKIKVDGKISASSPSISIETLKDKIACTLAITLGNGDGKIAIGKAVGKVEYEIPGHFAVTLGDIPEELKSDDIILDLGNPEFSMSVSTNLGIPIAGDMTITPWRGGKALTDRASVFGLELPYSLSADVTEIREYPPFSGGTPSLKDLVRQIPDSLVIDLNAGVVKDSDCIIEPSATYTAGLDYELKLPLELGEETNLSFNTDFDIKEIATYLVGNKIGITGNVVNGTPLVLRAKLNILDVNGNIIQSASPETEIFIKGKTTSTLEFYLNVPETIKPEDIDKGNLVLTIGSVGGAIHPDDELQITGLAAHIPEGITIKTTK